MGDRVFDDDRPTVDLGPQALDEPTEAADSEADDADVDPTQSHHGAAHLPYPRPPVDPVHALPTQQIPDKRRGGTSSLTKLSESRTTTSPVEAMKVDEIERTRVFLKVAFLISVGGAIIALITSGDVIAQRVVTIGSAFGALGAVWILLMLRHADDYEQRRVILPGLCLVIGAMSGVYYWGAGSQIGRASCRERV